MTQKIKCPFCKGQNNQDRETLYLYPSGTYWCARCKAYGSVGELGDVDFKFIPKEFTQPKSVNYNGKGERYSVCRLRNYDGYKDTFQIKDVGGNLVGHYNRLPDKQSFTEGKRLFAYKDTHLHLGKTYRIVEGVYDCIYPEDVATLGIPTREQAKQLKYFNLILCPDGDVWLNDKLFVSWFIPFLYSNVVGVEWIKQRLDPDEVTKDQRIQVDWKKVKAKLWALKN